MMTDWLWQPLTSHNIDRIDQFDWLHITQSTDVQSAKCLTAQGVNAYLHFDDVLLSLGSLLPGKVLSLGVQSLLKQWQCQLGTDGCSRVVAGHIDELGL